MIEGCWRHEQNTFLWTSDLSNRQRVPWLTIMAFEWNERGIQPRPWYVWTFVASTWRPRIEAPRKITGAFPHWMPQAHTRKKGLFIFIWLFQDTCYFTHILRIIYWLFLLLIDRYIEFTQVSKANWFHGRRLKLSKIENLEPTHWSL